MINITCFSLTFVVGYVLQMGLRSLWLACKSWVSCGNRTQWLAGWSKQPRYGTEEISGENLTENIWLQNNQDIPAGSSIIGYLFLPALRVSVYLLLCSNIGNKNSSHNTPSSLLCHVVFMAYGKMVTFFKCEKIKIAGGTWITPFVCSALNSMFYSK